MLHLAVLAASADSLDLLFLSLLVVHVVSCSLVRRQCRERLHHHRHHGYGHGRHRRHDGRHCRFRRMAWIFACCVLSLLDRSVFVIFLFPHNPMFSSFFVFLVFVTHDLIDTDGILSKKSPQDSEVFVLSGA